MGKLKPEWSLPHLIASPNLCTTVIGGAEIGLSMTDPSTIYRVKEFEKLDKEFILIPSPKTSRNICSSVRMQRKYAKSGGIAFSQLVARAAIQIGLIKFANQVDTAEDSMKKAMKFPFEVWRDLPTDKASLDEAILKFGTQQIKDKIEESKQRSLLDPNHKEKCWNKIVASRNKLKDKKIEAKNNPKEDKNIPRGANRNSPKETVMRIEKLDHSLIEKQEETF